MRLFFALWPDGLVRRALHQLQQDFELPEAKQVDKEGLHVTLQYLGAVTEEQMDCIAAAASEINGHSFVLEIDHLDFWSRPEVLFAGMKSTPTELSDLVLEMGRKLQPCGLVVDARAYQPHITLYRKVRLFKSRQLALPIQWQVTGFSLILSSSRGDSPYYQEINSWQLKK